jgi:hypothetical protein
MLALIIPLWNYDCPGAPSKHPFLTLQAIFQVCYPFIQEVAFYLAVYFWWKHLKYRGYKNPKCSYCVSRVVAVLPVIPFPSVPGRGTHMKGESYNFFCCSSRWDLHPPVFWPQYPSGLCWPVFWNIGNILTLIILREKHSSFFVLSLYPNIPWVTRRSSLHRAP